MIQMEALQDGRTQFQTLNRSYPSALQGQDKFKKKLYGPLFCQQESVPFERGYTVLVYLVLAETELIPECVGFIWRQSVVRCSSGWRASWVGGQVLGKDCRSGRQSQWRWTNSTSHKSSNSWLPGWAVSEAILPALLFALALGDWSAESNRRAMTLSAGWHTALFPPGARRNGAVADYRGYKDTHDCRSLSPDMIPKVFTLRILLQTEICAPLH